MKQNYIYKFSHVLPLYTKFSICIHKIIIIIFLPIYLETKIMIHSFFIILSSFHASKFCQIIILVNIIPFIDFKLSFKPHFLFISISRREGMKEHYRLNVVSVAGGSATSTMIITWTCHACSSFWTTTTHGRIGTWAGPRYRHPWRSSGRVRNPRSGRWVFHSNYEPVPKLNFLFLRHFERGDHRVKGGQPISSWLIKDTF